MHTSGEQPCPGAFRRGQLTTSQPPAAAPSLSHRHTPTASQSLLFLPIQCLLHLAESVIASRPASTPSSAGPSCCSLRGQAQVLVAHRCHTLRVISCTSGPRVPSMSWGLCTSVPGPHSPTCPVSAQVSPPRGPPLTTLQTGHLSSTSHLTLTVLPLYFVYCSPSQAWGKVLFTAPSPVPGAVLRQSALRGVSQLSG